MSLDSALSAYKEILSFEQAEFGEGLEINASFRFAKEYQTSMFEGLYDNIKLTSEKPDLLRNFLSKHLLSRLRHTKKERNIINIAKDMRSTCTFRLILSYPEFLIT